jgi:hypothetical protein
MTLEMSAEDAENLIRILMENGWYMSDFRYLDIECECSENIILVGNKYVTE